MNSDAPNLAAASANASDLMYSSTDKCGWRLYISGGGGGGGGDSRGV